MADLMNGNLVSIAVKSLVQDGHMELLEEAEVSTETGVANDPRGLKKSRQVTIVSSEAWKATCKELGEKLPWTTRRANLLIEGINLQDSKGKVITIGDVMLEITFETKPCYVMDEAKEGLKDALVADWRGGVLCRVLTGGSIRPGDTVRIK